MKTKGFTFLLMLVFLMLVQFASAQKVSISVSEDSWVSLDDPEKNNNGITDLECGQMDTDTLKTREIFLKFNIKDLTGFVKSAKLEVVGAQKSDAGWVSVSDFYVDVIGINNSWGEDTLVWNNKPAEASDVLAEANIKDYATYQINGAGLAEFINSAMLNKDTLVSFVIRGKDEVNGSRVWISDKGWMPAKLKLEMSELEMTSVLMDSWVSEDEPDVNKNGITDLECSMMNTDTLKSHEVYLEFDISNYAGYVDQAMIQFTGAQKQVKDGWIELDHFYVDLYGTKSTWDETTLTWNNKTAASTGVLATIDVKAFKKYAIVSEELDNYINLALAKGDKQISFILRGKSETNGSRIWISDKGWEPAELGISTLEVSELSVSQDTWVSEDEPDVNFNGQTDLQVATLDTDTLNSREAYVQFNIKNLAGYVNFSALRMTAAQKEVKDGWIELDEFIVEVYGTSNKWKEDTTTWNNKPGALGAPLAEINITKMKSYEISTPALSEYLNQAIARKDTLVSFVFKGKNTTNGSRVWISDQGWVPVLLNVETLDNEVKPVSEDTWVSEDEPDINFNGITDMQVATMNTDTLMSREAYLKFDIRELDAPQASVTLRIVAAQKEVKDGWIQLEHFNVGVYGTGNAWKETELNWGTKPKTGNLLATKDITNFTYYYITSDAITEYVNNAIVKGDTVVSFVIKGMAETNGSRAWVSDMGWEPAKLILDDGIRSVVNVESVSLDLKDLNMQVGQSVTIAATVLPEEATDPKISWSTSDASVVTVNNGLITAVGVGNALVIVTTNDGSLKDTCKVGVTAAVAVTGISLNKTTLTLAPGTNEQLEATVAPEDATNQDLVWTTSKPLVATVSNGKVLAMGLGDAVITVKTVDGNFTATCDVTVTNSDGIENAKSTDFIVYPNPAKDQVKVRYALNSYEFITITTLNGKTLIQVKVDSGNEATINLNGIPSGYYIISLRGKNHTSSSYLMVE